MERLFLLLFLDIYIFRIFFTWKTLCQRIDFCTFKYGVKAEEKKERNS